MKNLLSSATLLLALLGMTLAGCATAPAPAEKKDATKTAKSDTTPHTARTEKKPAPRNTLPPAATSSKERQAAKNPAAASPIPEHSNPATDSWQITVIQNATAMPANHEKVILKKAPFTLRVTLPMPQPVRFNASPMPSNLAATHTGKKLNGLCNPEALSPFCLTHHDDNRSLWLENLTHHYFFYRNNVNHSWMNVNITPQHTTLEWTITTINNKPVSRYRGNKIYMTLWVDSGKRQVFENGEMKQIVLSFSQ